MAKKEKMEALVPVEEQPYPVPENWRWVRFTQAFMNKTDSKKKVQQKAYLDDGKIPVVDQGQALIGGYTDDIDMKYKGALPVIIFGDHTRCIKFVDFDFAQGADGVKVLYPNSLFIPLAFFYAFRNMYIPNMGYRRHFPLLSNMCIAVPPIREQKRIVDHIESLFAKLDEAKEKAQTVVDGFEDRKAAILHKAFTGELTSNWRKKHGIADSWDTVPFCEVAEIKSNLVDPADYQNYPHIAPDNIEKKTGKLLEYHTIAEDAVTSGKHLFHTGQILYSKIRPYLSKVVVVDFDGLCSADMYPIDAKEDMQIKFLWYYMLSDDFLLQASSSGSRSVLPKINQKEMAVLKMRTTSKEEQEEVVRILDKELISIQTAKEIAEQTIEQIDQMKKSILAKAFRGELGTNDPSEPPVELE